MGYNEDRIKFANENNIKYYEQARTESYSFNNRHMWACMDTASTGESYFKEWFQTADLIDGYYKNHKRFETRENAVKYIKR
jgi:hypothetical protein